MPAGPSRAEAGFSTPSLKVAPTEVAAGRRHWVSPRAGDSRAGAPDPAFGRAPGAGAGVSVLRGLSVKKWLETDLPGILVRETSQRRAHPRRHQGLMLHPLGRVTDELHHPTP